MQLSGRTFLQPPQPADVRMPARAVAGGLLLAALSVQAVVDKHNQKVFQQRRRHRRRCACENMLHTTARNATNPPYNLRQHMLCTADNVSMDWADGRPPPGMGTETRRDAGHRKPRASSFR